MVYSRLNSLMEMVVVFLFASIPMLAIAVFFYGLVALVWPAQSCGAEFIGRMNANPFDPESCSNPYSECGNPFSANSPNNPFGPYGNPYSPYSVNNPYATDAPSLYGHADE